MNIEINGIEYFVEKDRTINGAIYWLDDMSGDRGKFLFSFDLKKVYNFFSDYHKLSDIEKLIFKTANPILAKLKE